VTDTVKPCECRCHLGGAHVSCDVDTGSSGVPGVPSCSPCNGVDVDEIPLDERCVLGHPEPVERYVGYLCRRHYHWVDRTLQQIEELYALLPDVLIPGPGGDGRGSKQVGSPAPGRIEIMALTDPRNSGTARPMTPYLNSDGRGGLESNGDAVPDFPGQLASWAQMLIEERPLENEDGTPITFNGTVSESVKLLRRERHWIASQEWVDEYTGELHDLHRAVARGVGDSMWPKPIGKCPNCGTAMYPTIGADVAHCRRCKSSWTGVNLARLRLIHEQEAKTS